MNRTAKTGLYENTANESIRNKLREYHIPLWELAYELHYSESTVCKWLRTELPDDKKEEIVQVIEKIHKKEELKN